VRMRERESTEERARASEYIQKKVGRSEGGRGRGRKTGRLIDVAFITS